MYKFDSIIKNLRMDSKMTQKELALAIGVSQQTVSLWESRSAVPDALAIIAIWSLQYGPKKCPLSLMFQNI